MLERIFGLREHGTTVGRELTAGTTTFLTMAYIIIVNPAILSTTGMDKGALITVTILASVLGTVLVGLWANVPLAMAPGMGLNAFFTYSLALGQGIGWQKALGVVFISGMLFLILTLVGVREKVVGAIPLSLRLAVAAGIGLFIAFIGFQNMGLIVKNDATLVGLGEFDKPVILGLTGLLITGCLTVRKVRGAMLLGIALTTILGAVLGCVSKPAGWFSLPPNPGPILLKLDILGALSISLFGAIFSFMFVDLFDSIGTIVACAHQAGFVKADGSIEKIGRILEADAIATVAGTLMGTSTTTTYIESGSGIAVGGRTGLTSVTVGLLFLLALFVTPLIAVVPGFATAPALVMVGIYMFQSIASIDFTRFDEAIPAFLTIALMPLTYSISTGLMFGFLAYILVAVASGNYRKLNPVLWTIGALALLELLITTGIAARLLS